MHPVRQAIIECFATDKDLLEKWHIAAPGSLNECVERTMLDLATTFDDSFVFHPFIEEGDLAGYWGTEFGNYVNLIFVKPQYRYPEFMKRFWRAIEASVESPFYTAVYAKNEPAVNFYSKRGNRVKEFMCGGNRVVSFKFHRGTV